MPGPEHLFSLQIAFVGDRLAADDQHFELCGLVSLGTDLDAVRARLDRQLLEHAVEAVDLTDVVTVDIDLAVLRLHLQTNGTDIAILPAAVAAAVAGVRVVVVTATAAVAPHPRIVEIADAQTVSRVVVTVGIPAVEGAVAVERIVVVAAAGV